MAPNNDKCWLAWLARLVAISSGVYFFSLMTADPDLWGHLKFGQDLWKAGAIPLLDPYSFTVHGGPWINHEWLAELICFGCYHFFSSAGLLLGKLAIGLFILGLMDRICARRETNPLSYALAMVLGAGTMAPGFMIRPQLFSFLFFAVFIWALHAYFSGNKKALYLLPPVMVLWVNLHGGFLMGWTLLAVALGWQTGVDWLLRRKIKAPALLWICFVLTSLAALANPYGYKLLVFLVDAVSMKRPISEWAPVQLFDLSFLPFKLLVVLFFIVLAANWKQSPGWEVMGILMTLAGSVLHQRHMPFFGIIAAPYVVFGLSRTARRIAAWRPSMALTSHGRALFGILLCGIILCQLYSGALRYVRTGCRVIADPDVYPVAAVRFIQQNSFKGNLLTLFDWGEYAIWKLYPDCRVSIDGRFETVYPPSVIADHFFPQNSSAGWTRLLEKYPSDMLLVRQNPYFQSLISNSDGKWVYVYSDRLAIVFLKNSEKNRPYLERMAANGFVYSKAPVSPFFP